LEHRVSSPGRCNVAERAAALLREWEGGSLLPVGSLGGKRVLLVDDDEAQREIVEEILKAEDMVVVSAASADEAIGFLDQDPDVVLMDLHGVRVDFLLDSMRRRPRRPGLLVVSGDLRLAEHASRLGADGHLAKPYELDDLLQAVTRVLVRVGRG
jgi:two-component system, chemotaxis family, chemotaxis protein CheY